MSLADAFREELTSWLDQFSRDTEQLNASLVAIGSKGAIHLIAEGLPFLGISADWKTTGAEVIISLDKLDHIVSDVIELDLDETEGPPATIRLKSGDGSMVIVHLS